MEYSLKRSKQDIALLFRNMFRNIKNAMYLETTRGPLTPVPDNTMFWFWESKHRRLRRVSVPLLREDDLIAWSKHSKGSSWTSHRIKGEGPRKKVQFCSSLITPHCKVGILTSPKLLILTLHSACNISPLCVVKAGYLRIDKGPLKGRRTSR